MTQSGIVAASETDVAALSSGQSLDFNDDTLKGNYINSLEDAKEATDMRPLSVKPIIAGAKALTRLNLFKLAIMWCDRGLAIETENTALMELRKLATDMDNESCGGGKSKHEQPDSTSRVKDFLRNCHLGDKAFQRGDNKIARYYCELALKEAKGIGNKDLEVTANNLGDAYYFLGDLQKAIEFSQLRLSVAKKTGNKNSEGTAYNNLGAAYRDLGDLQKAIEFFQLSLSIAEKTGNKNSKGTTYNNLGLAYHDLGDLQKAIEFFQLSLSIAEKTGNKDSDGTAYNNLGRVYHDLGDLQKAIEFFQLSLSIAEKTGHKNFEGTAYNNLGRVYHDLGDLQKAIEFFRLSLSIAKKTGNKNSEGGAYNNLGLAYQDLGDLQKAIEFYQLNLSIAEKTGNKNSEGTAYNNLGAAYRDLGDLQKAIELFQLSLSIAEKTGNKNSVGNAYNNLGAAYHDLGDLQKAIEFYQLSLSIVDKTGNKNSEGLAYNNLGGAYQDLGDLQKAIEFFQLSLSISQKTGNKNSEGLAYNNLGLVYDDLGNLQKAIELYQLSRSIARKTGNKGSEETVYSNLACSFFSVGDVIKAEECAKSSIKLCEEMRDLLHRKDEWKINLRNKRDTSYTLLRSIQSRQRRTLEALFTAEAGRVQALMDLMESRYCVRESIRPSSEHQMELIMTISELISSPTIFVAEDEKLVSLWLLLKGQQCRFIQKEISVDLTSLIRETYQKIGVNFDVRGKDRSRDEPEDEESVALKTLYEVVFAPFSHLIKGEELIIVPDRSSFLIPYVALVDQNSRYLSETMRIRLVPSLRSLRLLAECPEGHHRTSGALLVGNPWVETVRINRDKFKPLPGAEKEVQMIGQILNIQPLTGRNATKDQVLRRLNSVSLVHIAAHGCPENGEIILSPNLADAKKPKEQDFRLTMRDVSDAQLRAKLVVLSCCFSARGEIKAEGVVGIARAFLGAGARSVIASLWALSDEDTLEFMRHFYRHLVAGQSASKSLHHAMGCMREIQEFNAVKYWAPFVLIGDDVTINFGQ